MYEIADFSWWTKAKQIYRLKHHKSHKRTVNNVIDVSDKTKEMLEARIDRMKNFISAVIYKKDDHYAASVEVSEWTA